jgi:predicted transcriptional regulator
MAKTAPHATEAEFSVLAALWETGGQSARELTERLYPSCTAADVATVQKLVQRLEAKGLVLRDRGGRVYRFSAAIPRNQFAGQQLSQLAEKLSGGSLTPLLVHLVENKRLSRAELDELRALFTPRKR